MITAAEIRHDLNAWADANTWEETAGQLRMSSLGDASVEELVEWYFTGKPRPSDEAVREASLGHALGHEIMWRLTNGLGYQIERREESIGPGWPEYAPESEAVDAPVLIGHIDGILDGELLEIVTVREHRFERILESKRIQDRKFKQVQTYLHFLGIEHAKVIVFSRERGRLYVLHIRRQQAVGESMERKARRAMEAIVAALDDGRRVEYAEEEGAEP